MFHLFIAGYRHSLYLANILELGEQSRQWASLHTPHDFYRIVGHLRLTEDDMVHVTEDPAVNDPEQIMEMLYREFDARGVWPRFDWEMDDRRHAENERRRIEEEATELDTTPADVDPDRRPLIDMLHWDYPEYPSSSVRFTWPDGSDLFERERQGQWVVPAPFPLSNRRAIEAASDMQSSMARLNSVIGRSSQEFDRLAEQLAHVTARQSDEIYESILDRLMYTPYERDRIPYEFRITVDPDMQPGRWRLSMDNRSDVDLSADEWGMFRSAAHRLAEATGATDEQAMSVIIEYYTRPLPSNHSTGRAVDLPFALRDVTVRNTSDQTLRIGNIDLTPDQIEATIEMDRLVNFNMAEVSGTIDIDWSSDVGAQLRQLLGLEEPEPEEDGRNRAQRRGHPPDSGDLRGSNT